LLAKEKKNDGTVHKSISSQSEHASGDNNNLPRLFTKNEGLQKMLLSWGRNNAANLL
jgi:hypothetical protein